MSYDKDPQHLKAEKYADRINQDRREDASALNGMTLGILLAVAISAAATAFYFFDRRNETEPVPVIAPSAAPAAPEKETIIREEKTREIVPVPQATSEPNVNIIVPPSSAPSPATAPSASDKSTAGSSAQSPAAAQSPSSSPSSSPIPVN
jgi:hypothetical protein